MRDKSFSTGDITPEEKTHKDMVLDTLVSRAGLGLGAGILVVGTINGAAPSIGWIAGMTAGTVILDTLGFNLIAWILVIVMIFNFKSVVTAKGKKRKFCSRCQRNAPENNKPLP